MTVVMTALNNDDMMVVMNRCGTKLEERWRARLCGGREALPPPLGTSKTLIDTN